MSNNLAKIKDFVLDTLFPIYCINCGIEGKDFICKNCFKEIELNKKQECPKCRKENLDGKFCKSCEYTSRMKGVIIAASYENDLLQKAIHCLKYKYIRDLAKPLADILAFGLKSTIFKDKIDKSFCVLPIPLHRKKERLRGFNQAGLIGQNLANSLGLNFLDKAMIKTKNTKAQMSLNPLFRRKNIKNAFSCIKPKDVKNKKIIIVDDVCTTSATLEECAKTLHDNGAKEIWGAVLARGK